MIIGAMKWKEKGCCRWAWWVWKAAEGTFQADFGFAQRPQGWCCIAWVPIVVVVQLLSHVWLFVMPWTAAHLILTVSLNLLKLMSIDSVMPSNHLILLPSYPPALSLSQYQGLFQWVDSSHQVAKVLELQLQHQSFQWIFRVDFLEDWLVWSPCSPRDSQESSPTP